MHTDAAAQSRCGQPHMPIENGQMDKLARFMDRGMG